MAHGTEVTTPVSGEGASSGGDDPHRHPGNVMSKDNFCPQVKF